MDAVLGLASPRAYAAEAVEDTRQHIRRLAAEIARLARAGLAPEEFYAQFLPRVVAALGASGGVVWVMGEGGELVTAYHVNLGAARLDEAPETRSAHDKLLARALSGGAMAVPPQASVDKGQGANPTDLVLLFAPLDTELERVGLVEVFQRPEAALAALKQLRFLADMCRPAGDFLRGVELRRSAERQALWAQLEEFACQVHASLDPVQAAYSIANEGRRLIDCDRVSVAVRRGGRLRLEAVSGQSEIDRRSNVARLLARLCAAAAATGEPIWYTGESSDLAPQVERTVQQYLDKTNTKALGVLPLAAPDAEGGGHDKRASRTRPAGVLVVERIGDCRVPPQMLSRVEAVCRHGGAALANALAHDAIFLRPLWQAVGRNGWITRASALPKAALLAGVLAALGALLLLYPANLELEAKGTLQPAVQRDVFAGTDGRVERVHVAHRDPVRGPGAAPGEPGTLLCELRNHDLEEQIARITGERATVEEQIAARKRSLLEERLTVQEQNRVSAEQAELGQRLQNLDAQLELCRQKQKELMVYSPADGQVVTWDVHNLLIHRPVERGQRLMRIADTGGPWQLELLVPEDRIGHVLRAQADAKDKLRVRFILATDPGTTYEGTLVEIQHSAEVRGPEGNTVLATVAVDKTKLPHLMPGAGVTAKLDCGHCSLGYDLLHDVIAWVQRTWFRM